MGKKFSVKVSGEVRHWLGLRGIQTICFYYPHFPAVRKAGGLSAEVLGHHSQCSKQERPPPSFSSRFACIGVLGDGEQG